MMTEAPMTLESDELSQLAGQSYEHYMDIGWAKFVVSFARTVAINFDVDLILTGSSADGSKVDGSDVDVMFCPRSITLDESCFEYNEKCPCYFRVPRDKINEERVKYVTDDGRYLTTKSLKELSPNLFKILKLFQKLVQINNCLCLSKVGFVLSTENDPQREVSTGVSEEQVPAPHVDLVPSFTISGCEKYMSAWSCRKRQWPPSEIVESITQGKFHAVAKVSPLSGDEEKDFCLSFTVAEKTLMTSMSDDQLLCMRILKLIRSKLHDLMKREHPESFHTASSDSQGTTDLLLQDVFTSYHFKMAMFWVSETTNPSCWSNTTECVNKVLSFFRDCLECKCLPLYFVPSMNLFCAFSETTMQIASEVIRRFISSNVILREIFTDRLDNTPSNSSGSTTRAHVKNKSTLTNIASTITNIADVINSFPGVRRESDSERYEDELPSAFNEVRSLFKEFVYPMMVMQGASQQECDGNASCERESVDSYETRGKPKLNAELSEKFENYRMFNSEMVSSSKHVGAHSMANFVDSFCHFMASPDKSESKFLNLVTGNLSNVIANALTKKIATTKSHANETDTVTSDKPPQIDLELD